MSDRPTDQDQNDNTFSRGCTERVDVVVDVNLDWGGFGRPVKSIWRSKIGVTVRPGMSKKRIQRLAERAARLEVKAYFDGGLMPGDEENLFVDSKENL